MNINDQLFIAAQVSNITKAIELVAKADVDAVYKLGATPLYIAAQNGHLDMTRLLLRKGADPEFKFSNGMTPLCIAAYNGHEAVAQMLIDYGADIEVKIGSATILHMAAQYGQKKVVKLLLENGFWGLYNMVCSGVTGRYEVTHELIKVLGKENEIKITPVQSDYWKKEYFAERPSSERLINKKLDLRKLNIMRDWRVCLKEYINSYYQGYLD